VKSRSLVGRKQKICC